MQNELLTLLAPDDWVGLRIDKAISKLDKIGSRSRAEHLIAQKKVLVRNKSVKSSYLVRSGDEISIEIGPPHSAESIVAKDVAFEILFEDRDLIVINKPAGLVVHPAAGHQDDTLVNGLFKRSSDGLSADWDMKFGENRPGIVHRLDKDTSGILVVAKNDRTQVALTEQFRARSIHRLYLAAVRGRIATESGTLRSFIARHPKDRQRMASVRNAQNQILRLQVPGEEPPVGKWAVTHYQVLQRPSPALTYLQLKLETGRTHQIRVHLSEMGHPILSDTKYGDKTNAKTALPRFALHAAELGFTHPTSGERKLFQVGWPADLHDRLEALGIRLRAGGSKMGQKE